MDKANILTQLFEKDFAVKEIELIPGKLKVKIRNIGFEDQSDLEEKLKSYRDSDITNRQFLQIYAINLLSRTIVSWGEDSFPHHEQWEDFLKGKSIAVIDKLTQEQQKFEKEVRGAIKVEEITNVFSQEGESTDGSEPSQKESTSAKETA